MATPEQIAANRENAKQSCGPVTPQGKYESARNGMKFNLSSRYNNFIFLEDENPLEFEHLHAALTAEHQPSGPTAEILVRQMAQAEWLRARAVRATESAFAFAHLNAPDRQKQLALLMRYETMHERAFYRALNELRTARKERRNEEIGFASQELKLQTAIRARKALDLKEQAFEFKKQCWQERKTPPPTPKTVETVSQILPAAA